MLLCSCGVGGAPCPAEALPLPRAADHPTIEPHGAILLRYFPPPPALAVHFLDGTTRDVFPRSWFAGKLLDFKEAPLFERRDEKEFSAYRVLFLPSLNAVGDYVLRVERRGAAHGKWKEAVFCGGTFGRGATIAMRSRSVADSSWAAIDECMHRFFWNAPSAEPDRRLQGEDGWTTMIEGVEGGRYHAVERWNLECGKRYLGLQRCETLMAAALGSSRQCLATE